LDETIVYDDIISAMTTWEYSCVEDYIKLTSKQQNEITGYHHDLNITCCSYCSLQ
jgi:hypothetical protein